MREGAIIDLEAPVSEPEILRRLGYRRGKRPTPRVLGAMVTLLSLAAELARPRGCYRLVHGDAVRDSGMPTPTEMVGVGLCTIGPALEEELARRSASGAILDALLLDAYGSSAAEAAAESLDVILRRHVSERGLFAARRISPGYRPWDITGQTALLGLLPAVELGVHLTTGLMMVPRKSVSFAVRLANQPVEESPGPQCATCGLLSCPHRQDPTDPLETADGCPARTEREPNEEQVRSQATPLRRRSR